MDERTAVLGSGVITSVGLSAEQCATAVEAGISRVREIDEVGWCAADLQPYRGGWLQDEFLQPLHRKTQGIEADSITERLLRLGGFALGQVSDMLAATKTIPPLILAISDVSQLPGGSPELLLDNLARQAGVRLDLAQSEVVIAGRAAGLVAVQRTVRRLAHGQAGFLLVGAIDSYFDHTRLGHLDARGRILNDVNLDGFLPGEGAAFLLLAKDGRAAGLPGVEGYIRASKVGMETGHLDSEQPLLGDGLAEVISAAFEDVPQQLLPCRRVLSNLNGERLFAREWGVAHIRNKQYFAEGLAFEHPAEFMGDVGAAMGPVLIALALRGGQASNGDGNALVWCSSDGPERAAAYVSRS